MIVVETAYDPAHGIVHDSAYWVSDIRQRKAAYEDVDLFTHACGGSIAKTETGSGQGGRSRRTSHSAGR